MSRWFFTMMAGWALAWSVAAQDTFTFEGVHTVIIPQSGSVALVAAPPGTPLLPTGILWDMARDGRFDLTNSRYAVEQGAVRVNPQERTGLCPTGLGHLASGTPPVERIDILYTSPEGPYTLEVTWHPGGSGRESFNIFLDDVLVASSRTRDGALDPYREEAEQFEIGHVAGRHVLSLRRISGDGLHFTALKMRHREGTASPGPSPLPYANRVELDRVEAYVTLDGQAAETTLDIYLSNPGPTMLESVLILPVPDGAVVKSFRLDGMQEGASARLLPREEASRMYRSIVNQARDPALLEYVGYNLVQSSVFPVGPQGTQRLHLVYEHLAPRVGNHIEYLLPRSVSVERVVVWDVTVRVGKGLPVTALYSPSHEIITRSGQHGWEVETTRDASRIPGPFRLVAVVGGEEQGVPSVTFLSTPDTRPGQAGGFFLMLAAPPLRDEATAEPVRREVTLVFDRSGSMRGEKMEQVRAAAMQVLEGLDQGEAFNVIAFNESVRPFSERPIYKDHTTATAVRLFLESVEARGGTNISGALEAALSQPPSEGMLPLVLFLTDGLPTIGDSTETGIRRLVRERNPHHRRVFTFGVGTDVNSPLLDKVAADSRATATFILPGEPVHEKVVRLFKRLSGPVLAGPFLSASSRIAEVFPEPIPDLFTDDQLVITGQYTGNDPVTLRLGGSLYGKPFDMPVTFDPNEAAVDHAFVARLWASRKIASLIEAVRVLGGNGAPATASGVPVESAAARELVDEIIRLSTTFGILTEYTAFLAEEGSPPDDPGWQARHYEDVLGRAFNDRSGLSAISQESNKALLKQQRIANPLNTSFGVAMQPVSTRMVQQVNSRAFIKRGGAWVDTRLDPGKGASPSRVTVSFGSDRYFELADRLARVARQAEMALIGPVLIEVDGTVYQIEGPVR